MLTLLLLVACQPTSVELEGGASASATDLSDLKDTVATLSAQVETLSTQVDTLTSALEAEAAQREEGDVLQQQDINDLKDQYAALSVLVAELSNGTGDDTGSSSAPASPPMAWFSEELLAEGTRWENLSEVAITVDEDTQLLAFCAGAPLGSDGVQLQLILFSEAGSPLEGSEVQTLNAGSAEAPPLVASYAFAVDAGSYVIACEGSGGEGFASSWTSVFQTSVGS